MAEKEEILEIPTRCIEEDLTDIIGDPECKEFFSTIEPLDEEKKEEILDIYTQKLEDKEVGKVRQRFSKWTQCINPQTYLTLQNVKWIPSKDLYIVKEGDRNYCFSYGELCGMLNQYEQLNIAPRNPATRKELPLELFNYISQEKESGRRPQMGIEEAIDTVSILTPGDEEVQRAGERSREKESKIRAIEEAFGNPEDSRARGYTDPYISVEQYLNLNPGYRAPFLPYSLNLGPNEMDIIDYLYHVRNQYFSGLSKAYLMIKVAILRNQLNGPFGTSEEREAVQDQIDHYGTILQGGIRSITEGIEIPIIRQEQRLVETEEEMPWIVAWNSARERVAQRAIRVGDDIHQMEGFDDNFEYWTSNDGIENWENNFGELYGNVAMPSDFSEIKEAVLGLVLNVSGLQEILRFPDIHAYFEARIGEAIRSNDPYFRRNLMLKLYFAGATRRHINVAFPDLQSELHSINDPQLFQIIRYF